MFSRSMKAGAAAKAMRSGGSFSVIGADATIAGNVTTAENVQVNGRIEGDVRCGALHQGASGTIVGHIVADEARLAGLVDGTVTARLLILDSTARITGDVSYETLSIAGGARVEGRFAHREAIADAGTKEAASPAVVTELFPAPAAASAAE